MDKDKACKMTVNDILYELNVDKNTGLDEQKINLLRDKHGFNELTPPKEKSIFKVLFEAVTEPMMIILLIAAALSFLINQIEDGIGIICAIIIGISIGIIVEGNSKKAADELKKVCENINVKVLREGKVVSITSRELVVGDIVMVEQGDKIPADGRLLEGFSLKIDESMLTGESEPVSKNSAFIAKMDKTLTADMINMLFSGTLVTEGYGKFVVTSTGDLSEVGKISQNLAEDGMDTPLQQKLGHMGEDISKVSAIVALSIFVFMIMQRMPNLHIRTNSFKAFLISISPIKDAFVICVALIVAAVPEGLPTMVNMTLALTMKKMAKTNALVRKKDACETIGSVSIICSDKTGTLTQNKMKVVDTFIGNNIANRRNLDLDFIYNCALNSTAELGVDKNGTVFIGNTTECALLQYLRENNVRYEDLRQKIHVSERVEFSSKRKCMYTLIKENSSNKLYIKGAPEMLLARCKYIKINGKVTKLNNSIREDVAEKIKMYQRQAKRVLAFAYKEIEKDNMRKKEIEEQQEFIFIGFVGIMDPLRPDVKNAIKTAKKAGVETKILTGDNIDTARAIAEQLNLLNYGKRAILSQEIDSMDDETLKSEIDKIAVIARSTPETKMRIVEILKIKNEVVAVTGDGINDAPALIKSDVGIAMGITGSEVAQEASDVILRDDSFSTIIKAIRWGRSIYENFQRFIQFQLTVNIVAFLAAILSIVFKFKLPFTTIQLLWVNIIMDGPPALSLGLEPVRKIVLKRKPINRKDSIITAGMLRSMISSAILITIGILVVSKFPQILVGRELNTTIYGNCADDKIAGTVLFCTFSFFALWNAFNCREFGNDSIFPHFFENDFAIKVIVSTAILQIVIVQFASKFFNAVPLDVQTWLRIIIYTSSIVIIKEIQKLISRLVMDGNKISEESIFFRK